MYIMKHYTPPLSCKNRNVETIKLLNAQKIIYN